MGEGLARVGHTISLDDWEDGVKVVPGGDTPRLRYEETCVAAISKRADNHASRICSKQSPNHPSIGNIHIAGEMEPLIGNSNEAALGIDKVPFESKHFVIGGNMGGAPMARSRRKGR